MAGRGRRRACSAAAAVLALIAGPAFEVAASAGAAPSGKASFHLDRVWCSSATFCMAVGSRGYRMSAVDNSSKTLSERWNGTKWSIVPSPNGLPAGTSTALYDVSCTGSAFCMAVGEAGTKIITMTWNGSKWSTVASANPTNVQYAYLTGVSCTSTTNCVAAGLRYTPDGRGPTLMERWNGKAWSILNAPTPPGNNPVRLHTISCPQATNCYAVGEFDLGGPGKPAALALKWNGTTFSLAYETKPKEVNTLFGVSCVDPSNCTAVGWTQTVYPSRGPIRTMVERWNGTKWSRLSSPSPGNGFSELLAASCISSTRCTAVGDMSTTAGERTLVERSSGTVWSPVAGANAAPPATSWLSGISCRSPANCIAVGHTALQAGTVSEHFSTLAEKWTGKGWTILPGPQPSPT
jgi:hypothetical protein